MTRRVGIMGGTFDPIHIGHLVTATEALEQFGLDEVVFMVAGRHPLKDARITDAHTRLEMVKLAIQSNPAFTVSDFEVNKDEISYTIDTLRYLKDTADPETEFYFITGADALFDILEWKDAAELAEMTTLIGATRPGYDLAEAKHRHDASLEHFDVRYMEVPALAVSSTDIRRRVANNRDITYLVGEKVARFIGQHHLYLDEKEPVHG